MQELAKAVIAVMTEINGVAKNMTVGAGASSYKGVSDKDVRQKMRDSMIANGLSILPIGVDATVKMDRWEETDYQGKIKTKQSVFTEAVTKYLLLHVSGESVELSGYGHGVDTQDKGAGKATTYAMKNTLLNMFLVPTGVDTDDTHSDDLPVPKKYPSKALKDGIQAIKTASDSETLKSLYDELKNEVQNDEQKKMLNDATMEAKQRIEMAKNLSNG